MSKGKARSVWIPEATWDSMKKAAKAEGRSVSNYVLRLHTDFAMDSFLNKRKDFIPVIREDRDLTEEERDEHPEEVTAIDDIVTTEVEIPESKSVLKRKAIQNPNADSAGTADWRKDIKARPKGEDGKKTK